MLQGQTMLLSNSSFSTWLAWYCSLIASFHTIYVVHCFMHINRMQYGKLTDFISLFWNLNVLGFQTKDVKSISFSSPMYTLTKVIHVSIHYCTISCFTTSLMPVSGVLLSYLWNMVTKQAAYIVWMLLAVFGLQTYSL